MDRNGFSDSVTIELDRSFRAACAEIDRRVRQGESRIAETWADTAGPLAEDNDKLVELIFTEFATREAHGQAPTPAEYYERFPQLAERLRRLFEVDELLKADDALAGTAIDRQVGAYELREKLGAGGMGVVFRGWHPVLRRDVAIKLLGPLAGEGSSARFLREGRAIAALNHPNIVHLYEVGEQDGRPYLVMEYVAGGSLRERLTGQVLPPRTAATLMATLADAIQHAHSQGILHRDLKPGNILLESPERGTPNAPLADTGMPTPKIADFGLATRLDQAPTSSGGQAVGTPSYMAPEQAEGKSSLTPGVDVYALGAVLYETLVGRPPFLGDSASETLLRVLREEPVAPRQIRAAVPRDLETICLKCLQKQPARRYQTAAELADDLRRFAAGEPIRARAVGPVERSIKFARRRPMLTATLALTTVALFVIAIGWIEFTRRLSDETRETKRQRERADLLRERADELRIKAEEERAAAQSARHAAELERERALTLLSANRESLYVARLLQAAFVRSTDPLQARALLESPEWCPPERRDFVWRYLHAAGRVQPYSVHAKTDGANAMTLSPDRKLLVVAGMNGALVGVRTDDGREAFRNETAHMGPITAVAVTATGKQIVSAGIDGIIRVWNADGAGPGRELGRLGAPVYALAVTSAGMAIAGGGRGAQGGKLAAWNIADGSAQAVPAGERAIVRSLALSPDSDTLVLGFDSGEVIRWSIARQTIVNRFRTGPDRVQSLAIRDDGVMAIVAPGRTQVPVWDGSTGRKIRDIAIPYPAWAVAFNPSGHTLAISEASGRIAMYRAADGQLANLLRGASGRRDFMRVPNLDERLIGGDHPNQVVAINFAADNDLYSLGADDSVSQWRLDSAPKPQVGPSCHFPAGDLVALPGGRTALMSGRDKLLRRCDLTTGEIVEVGGEFPWPVSRLALADEGKHLFVVTGGVPAKGQPALWQVHSCRAPDFTVRVSSELPAAAAALIPTADGQVFIVSREGKIFHWDPRANIGVQERWTHPQVPMFAAYLDAGKELITLSADVVMAWPEGRRLKTTFPGPLRGVAAAPGGRQLAVWTADPSDPIRPRLYLWDALLDTPPRHVEAGRNGIISATFTPDGRTLGIVSSDRNIRLVNVATGEEMLTLFDTRDVHQGLVMSTDGKLIATLRTRTSPAETRVVSWVIPD